MVFLSLFKRRSGREYVMLTPNYSVKEIKEFVCSIAEMFHIESAYLSVPKGKGSDDFRPERATIIYLLGRGSTFADIHGFDDAVAEKFGGQVDTYPSGPNETRYGIAKKNWYTIL
jgi:hypothetical protein